MILIVLGAALLFTNPWFTVFDDEAFIISTANQPNYLSLFSVLQIHQHPPLSDLFLHFWLMIAGGKVWLIRLPFITFYVIGIWCCAKAAENLGTASSFSAVVWIGAFWPLGFHYGHAAGWYTLSFLLIALITWRYVVWIRSYTRRDLLVLTFGAAALVHTNYYGWVLIGILLGDFLVFHSRKTVLELAKVTLWICVIALSFWGHWSRLLVNIEQGTVKSGLAHGVYSLYQIFVSEAVAPWYFTLSLPAALAIAVCMAVVLFKAPLPAKKYLIYFAFALGGLVVAGAVGPKRLLFLCPWLLIALGIAASELRGKVRTTYFASLALICVIGFWGIVDRSYYASFHWLEPWPKVAKQLVERRGPDAAIITTHWSALFYLFHALPQEDLRPSERFTIDSPFLHRSRVYWPYDWEQLPSQQGRVLLLRGAADASYHDARERLDRECKLLGVENQLRDRGAEVKRRFFPAVAQPEWRIEIREYQCP